ncbi:MAG: PHB depolymerase family esterase [Candidatus Sulfotelmatobacter sp.]
MNATRIRLKTHPRFGPRDCALAVCALATILVAPSRGQETQEKIDVDDVSRNYTVHLPGAYNQAQHYPVVILLHARNQDADDMARLTHFNQFADKDGIIAVYPNATRGQWNIGVRPEQSSMAPRRGAGRRGGWGGGWPGGGGGGYPGGGGGGRQSGGQNPDETTRNRPEPADDVAFLNQMLDALALKYSVDARRIYVAGLEDGGFMALRVGCNMADRVAAIAAVGAALPKTMICLPSRAVPALFMNGTDDPIVPDNGGTYKPGQFHVLSAEDSAKAWAKFDRCAEKPAQDKIPPLQKGGKETKTYTYSGCQNNAQVVLYSVKGGGSTWPGGEQYMSEKEIGKTSDAINANGTIWSFLTTKTVGGDSGVEK